MADTVDMAAEYQASEIARGIAAARRPFDPGQPGECAECGDDSPRLGRILALGPADVSS